MSPEPPSPETRERPAAGAPGLLEEASFQQGLRRATSLLVAGLGLPLILLLGVTIYLLHMSQEVERTDDVLSRFLLVEKLGLDMETGLRGFALTREERFLDQFPRAKAMLPRERARLREAIGDDPDTLELARAQGEAIESWLAFASRALEPRDGEPIGEGDEVEGKSLMDAVRHRTDEAVRVVEAERAEKNRVVRLLRNVLVATLALGGLAGIPLATRVLTAGLGRLRRAYHVSLEAAEQRAEELQVTLRSIGAAEGQLAQSEARLRLLHELGEATRSLPDPTEAMAQITRLLGTHLHTSRCAYAEVAEDESFEILRDYVDGCPSTAGHYQLASFGLPAATAMREGRPLALTDVVHELTPAEGRTTFQSIQIAAIICCPLIKEGRLRAMLAVHQTTPRVWTEAERALVWEVAARSWAFIRAGAGGERVADQRGAEPEHPGKLAGCGDPDGRGGAGGGLEPGGRGDLWLVAGGDTGAVAGGPHHPAWSAGRA